MIAALNEKKGLLASLCERFGVTKLEVFGSAADGEFDPAQSDVDFLVEFRRGQDLGPWLSLYFELKEELEALLGRAVDLVMSEAMKNPYFIREVNRTRRTVYEAKVSEAS
jgi:hypothetical protein